MKKILFTVLFIFLLAVNCYAGDYYIAQTAAGSEDGSSCINADAIADLTWGSGQMVEAGDTLHICGTITSILTIGASGTSGNEIIILFETGAKFSTSAWGTSTSAAIYSSGKDYIIIDGNDVGTIECTDNGTALGTQQDAHGIYLSASDHWEIKDLTISNMYVRTADSNDSNSYGKGIESRNSEHSSFHDCNIDDAYFGIHVRTSIAAGDLTNIDIYDSVISNCSSGIVVSLGSDNSTFDLVNIYNNTISGANVWDGTWNGGSSWHHADGIHTWGRNATHYIKNIKIYNNIIGPDMGAHCTSWIYPSDKMDSVEVYNNVLYNTTEGPTSGFIHFNDSLGSDIAAKIYNNTIIGGDADGSEGTMAFYHILVTGVDYKNNIVYETDMGIYHTAAGGVDACNYNCWYSLADSTPFRLLNTTYTYAQWQVLGHDANSITSDPSLNAAYAPDDPSDPVVDTGDDLSGTFATDRLGVTRPQGSAWDMGAYEFEVGTFGIILKGIIIK